MSITSLFTSKSATDHPAVLDGRALDILFREARTHNGWQPKDVPEQLLREAVELTKMGPTSANASARSASERTV